MELLRQARCADNGTATTAAGVECKVVLVGDTKCGKTSLIHMFISETFNQVYSPTSFQKYTVTCPVNDFTVHFTIWDTSGAEAYDSVRPLAYQDAQVFLLCFSIADPQSLDNARNKWYPEIRDNCGGNASVILCGCQTDLRTGGDRQAQATVLTPEQGVSLSRQVGATTYVETSSKTSIKAVKDAFEVAALAAMGRINKRATISRFSSTAVQQQQGGASANKNNKVDLRNEIKVRAKSCNLM